MNKVGKITKPFSYDLNQILYDYTVEVTNRFKRLDLVDRVPEELWTEVHSIIQEAVTKTIPKKKKCKRRSGCLRRLYKLLGKKRSKRQGRKEKIYPHECIVTEINKVNKKAFLNEQHKEIEGNKKRKN